MASIIWVRSLPARPTKGRPCASSSAPGPSPTKTSLACGLPSPKTILLRVVCSLQRVHSPRSSRICKSVSLWLLFAASISEAGAGVSGRKAFAGAAGGGTSGGFKEDLRNGGSSIECDGVATELADDGGCDEREEPRSR